MKKAYLFFATGFEEVEALTVVDILRRGGVDCKTVSIMGDYDVIGSHGITIRADLVFEERSLEDADMLIMPGGIPGTPNLKAHAGLDESGKGDLFGPLVVATVIADGTAVDFWLSKGLKESKAIKSDERLFKMEALVREPKGVVIETAYANMERYNELYAKFGNLNQLLAWMHARALDTALQKSTVQKGLLDQFVKAHLVQKFLKRSDFTLQQRVRAEEDPVVAAASIIARATYVRKLRDLSKEAGINLPKGCGIDAQKALITLGDTVGRDQLKRYAKMHFKTIDEVLKS